jgi:hypothetical protein
VNIQSERAWSRIDPSFLRMTVVLKDVMGRERRIFFALVIADFYSEEDSSFLPMTSL